MRRVPAPTARYVHKIPKALNGAALAETGISYAHTLSFYAGGFAVGGAPRRKGGEIRETIGRLGLALKFHALPPYTPPTPNANEIGTATTRLHSRIPYASS